MGDSGVKQVLSLQWLRKSTQHWYGQAIGAAILAFLWFISMYGIYLHLSNRLPDGSKIYEKTGLYLKKNHSRGAPTSTIGSETSFCMVTAFIEGQCGFDGSGKTVTVTVTKFPSLSGDVDVVLTAVSNKEMLFDYGLEKWVALWRKQSLFQIYLFSFYAFVFAFLGLRGLNKLISKAQQQ